MSTVKILKSCLLLLTLLLMLFFIAAYYRHMDASEMLVLLAMLTAAFFIPFYLAQKRHAKHPFTSDMHVSRTCSLGIVLLLGIEACSLCAISAYRDRQLKDHGVMGQAVITGLRHVRTLKGPALCSITYSFSTVGVQHTETKRISLAEFESYNNGDTIAVQYVEGNPANNSITALAAMH